MRSLRSKISPKVEQPMRRWRGGWVFGVVELWHRGSQGPMSCKKVPYFFKGKFFFENVSPSSIGGLGTLFQNEYSTT